MKLFLAFFTILYATMLFGAYEVKIAVYKNAKNLHASIAKISNAKYRNSIKIEKKHNLYYAHAILASNKEAMNALHDYKKVFQDAFIADKQVKSKKSVKKETLPTPKPQPVAQVKKEEPKEQLFSKQLLHDKTVYLCYEKDAKVMNKRIIQMDFKDTYVEYRSLESEKKPLQIKYNFVQDNIIMPISGFLVTHKILEKKNNFLSVKSYINGKEAHSLRYYFDKKSALSFLESK